MRSSLAHFPNSLNKIPSGSTGTTKQVSFAEDPATNSATWNLISRLNSRAVNAPGGRVAEAFHYLIEDTQAPKLKKTFDSALKKFYIDQNLNLVHFKDGC